jgi:hypothetical protein
MKKTRSKKSRDTVLLRSVLINPVARRVIRVHPLGTFQISFQIAMVKDKNYSNVIVLPSLSPNIFGRLSPLSHQASATLWGVKLKKNAAESIDRERSV